MKEIWKDIIGNEGYYQVSNLGRVRSLDRTISHGKGESKRRVEGKMISQINTMGYLAVGLSMKGKGKFVKVHRLVAGAFISNPENKPCLNHKDRDRANNKLANLEWCTYRDNMLHIHETGANMCKGEDHKMTTLTSSQVLEIKLSLRSGETGTSLAEKFDVSSATISRIKTGKVWNSIKIVDN